MKFQKLHAVMADLAQQEKNDYIRVELLLERGLNVPRTLLSNLPLWSSATMVFAKVGASLFSVIAFISPLCSSMPLSMPSR